MYETRFVSFRPSAKCLFTKFDIFTGKSRSIPQKTTKHRKRLAAYDPSAIHQAASLMGGQKWNPLHLLLLLCIWHVVM